MAGQSGGGEGGWVGGRWYTLVPVSPLIKSSLKDPESEHTHIYAQYAHTCTNAHTLTFLV